MGTAKLEHFKAELVSRQGRIELEEGAESLD